MLGIVGTYLKDLVDRKRLRILSRVVGGSCPQLQASDVGEGASEELMIGTFWEVTTFFCFRLSQGYMTKHLAAMTILDASDAV